MAAVLNIGDISRFILSGAQVIPFQNPQNDEPSMTGEDMNVMAMPQLRIFPTGIKKANLRTLSREFASENGGYNMWTIPESLVKQIRLADIILFSPRDKAYFDKIATVTGVLRISEDMYKSVWEPYCPTGENAMVRPYVLILSQMREVCWSKAPILHELGLRHIQGPNMMNKYIRQNMGTNDCTIRYYLENNMGDLDRAYSAYKSLFINACMALWNNNPNALQSQEYPNGLVAFPSALPAFVPLNPAPPTPQDVDASSLMSDDTVEWQSDGGSSSSNSDDDFYQEGPLGNAEPEEEDGDATISESSDTSNASNIEWESDYESMSDDS